MASRLLFFLPVLCFLQNILDYSVGGSPKSSHHRGFHCVFVCVCVFPQMLNEANEDNLIDLGPGSPAVVSPRPSGASHSSSPTPASPPHVAAAAAPLAPPPVVAAAAPPSAPPVVAAAAAAAATANAASPAALTTQLAGLGRAGHRDSTGRLSTYTCRLRHACTETLHFCIYTQTDTGPFTPKHILSAAPMNM